ncbi:DUF2703 domain-containing protein [Trichococcus alkaliphilus]|uniref:DUF2703 domain-containing protein n=1 Tax=Trichococcus alkaliphilus TaxID=2052943 RepID=UPI000D0BA584|nr:DUF2703 domain-containing protein [Trichococcus alkaliphilus]
MNKDISGCCSGEQACCQPEQMKKQIVIDFLYLDLSTCSRCQGTETSLEQAIGDVAAVLRAAGYEIQLRKINITSEELAIQHRFLSSPTIRINGNDINLSLKESRCQECGDLCGEETDCRIWTHNGKEFAEPPKELIIDAILKAIYGEKQSNASLSEEYRLPENIRKFFSGVDC